MNRLSRRWKLALAGSIGVHLLLALILGANLSSKPTPNQLAVQPEKEIVQAVAINEQQILQEIERRTNIENAVKKKEAARKKRLEQEAARAKKLRKQEERKIAALKQKAKKEKIAQQKAKRQADKKRKAAELKEKQRITKLKQEQQKLKKQKQREQQQLADLTKQRKAEEQKRVEEKKRAEQQKLKEQKQAELKRLEDERIAVQKAAFEKQLAAEQQRLQKETNRAQQRKLAIEKNRYVALIREKVVRNWVKPSATREDNSCKVLVHQIPGGEVIDVKVTACSGSVAFRKSVETAVFKASPLPTPTTKELFDREIEFTFKP